MANDRLARSSARTACLRSALAIRSYGDTVDEAEELTGSWWLPESPEHRLHGTLWTKANGRCELSVYDRLQVRPMGRIDPTADGGSVRTVRAEDLERDGVYPRILGEVDGEPLTLDDCFMLHRRGTLASSVSYERILAQRVYRGIWLEEPEARFNSITVDMLGLAHWVGVTGLEGEWRTRRSRSRAISVHAAQLGPLPRAGRIHHVGLGAAHAGTPARRLVHGRYVIAVGPPTE